MHTTGSFSARHCAGAYRWAHVTSELRELAEARSYSDIREEFWDVLMAFQLWTFAVTGVDFPLVLTRRHHWKFERRRSAWRRIFESEGLVFRTRYLVNGSNHAKAWKVAAALELARSDQ